MAESGRLRHGNGATLAKFREAMTTPMIEAIANMVNAQLKTVFQGHNARTTELRGEIERLEGQASHLVRFLATGATRQPFALSCG